jgi:ammonium transporter Rh
VEVSQIPLTAVDVILALSASTLATYFVSVTLRGRISIADMANAALAGGVAIGSTCDRVSPGVAFLIGLGAGALSTFSFAVIQERWQRAVGKVDTCGVLHLHGFPGLFGGLVALAVVQGIDRGSQLTGILSTVVLAVVSGLVVGKLISLLGRREQPYEDAEELLLD